MGTRVLWLLNNKQLRLSDLAQLEKLGVSEIYLPKSYPQTIENIACDVDWSHDATLTIPPEDLEVMNAQDWYHEPSSAAWDIANKHFDVVFVGLYGTQITSAVWNFGGGIVLRATGFSDGRSYSKFLSDHVGEGTIYKINEIGRRFWFGAVHQHIINYERDYLVRRYADLPRGYDQIELGNEVDAPGRVIFYSPNINILSYWEKAYERFKTRFKDVNYLVLGFQPISVDDPKVLNSLSEVDTFTSLTARDVVFYQANEYFCIDEFPLQAISAGIPVIFIAGGMLDALGGADLAGRSRDYTDAVRNVRKVLSGDRSYVNKVITSQQKLRSKFTELAITARWSESWVQITDTLRKYRLQELEQPTRSKRIAIVIPAADDRSCLRDAKLIASAIYLGSGARSEQAEVVIYHLDDEKMFNQRVFEDLPVGIKHRSYQWQYMEADQAQRAMRYSGQEGWKAKHFGYGVPNDTMKQLMDCDLWLVMSDKVDAPILPLKPVMFWINGYLQRYLPWVAPKHENVSLKATRLARKVLVNTEFAKNDALQYAGVSTANIAKVPILVPEFWKDKPINAPSSGGKRYFMWVLTEYAQHNHELAFEALDIYYSELNGSYDCMVVGVAPGAFAKSKDPILKTIGKRVAKSRILRERLKWRGHLSDAQYKHTMAGSTFLWHPSSMSNGTATVVEAASFNVPTLASDYPVMREYDHQFELNITWMDATYPRDMAEKLKYMESSHYSLVPQLPTANQLGKHDVASCSTLYWDEVRVCL